LHHDSFRKSGFQPLCVDVETSSLCDLACPFCYRQSMATPDRLMSEELCYSIIGQCEGLNVPSMKFNWRGEPLLHPKLPVFIDRAKRAGVLDTIINTNAVTLDERKAREILDSGLDLMIYSFDGGSKKTYERMRPGRFRANSFEEVYENIRTFARLREETGSPFPRTKIQMILTEDTYEEQDDFFTLFEDCVDDVSVKAYSERGGNIADLPKNVAERLHSLLTERRLPPSTPYWRDITGAISIGLERLPCEQPFQRLSISYDGRATMCCYDWGCEYPVGCASRQAIEEGEEPYKAVFRRASAGEPGFERLGKIKLPAPYHKLQQEVCSLASIWQGETINDVREQHVEGHLGHIPICEGCQFKETYRWMKVEME
jgi:MoaA/NifB/PqqE/SkfB family radical SAM enzyme